MGVTLSPLLGPPVAALLCRADVIQLHFILCRKKGVNNNNNHGFGKVVEFESR